MEDWLADEDEQDLKETLLRDDRFLNIVLAKNTKSEQLIGRALQDIDMPEGSLVALIRRSGNIIVPRGRTRLEAGDRLTIIGEADGITALLEQYTEKLRS